MNHKLFLQRAYLFICVKAYRRANFIACWRLKYFSFDLSHWNFIQPFWSIIVFSVSINNVRELSLWRWWKVRAVGKSNWGFLSGKEELWYVNYFFFYFFFFYFFCKKRRKFFDILIKMMFCCIHLSFVGYLQTWRATLHWSMPNIYLYWSHIFMIPVLYFRWRLSL